MQVSGLVEDLLRALCSSLTLSTHDGGAGGLHAAFEIRSSQIIIILYLFPPKICSLNRLKD